MRESLAQHVRELRVVLEEMAPTLEGRRWKAGREYARRILAAGSKLHAQLTVLADVEDDAEFIADVDRALARERKGRPEPIPGDVPLPLEAAAVEPAPSAAAGRGTRKKKA